MISKYGHLVIGHAKASVFAFVSGKDMTLLWYIAAGRTLHAAVDGIGVSSVTNPNFTGLLEVEKSILASIQREKFLTVCTQCLARWMVT